MSIPEERTDPVPADYSAEKRLARTAGVTLGALICAASMSLVLAPDTSGEVLYERGFSWGTRSDDPFNR